MPGGLRILRLRGVSGGLGTMFGRRPGRLLGIFLILLVLPLGLDILADRPTLARVEATTKVLSARLGPDTPLFSKSLRFSNLSVCGAGSGNSNGICNEYGPASPAGPVRLDFDRPARIVLYAAGSAGMVLDILPARDTGPGPEAENAPSGGAPAAGDCQALVTITFEQPEGDEVFQPFPAEPPQPEPPIARCGPVRAVVGLGADGERPQVFAMRVENLVLGQPVGPASWPETPLLLSGELTLSASSLRRDLSKMLRDRPERLERFEPLGSHRLALGDEVRFHGDGSTDPAFLTLMIHRGSDAREGRSVISVSAVALTDGVEVSSYGMRGQVLRANWFDRLANDDLLGIWITALIIVASLWLEAVFLHRDGGADAKKRQE